MSRQTTVEIRVPIGISISLWAEVFPTEHPYDDGPFSKFYAGINDLIPDSVWEEIEAYVGEHIEAAVLERKREIEAAEERERQQRAAQAQESRRRRLEKLSSIGNGELRCRGCGKEDGDLLQIDHIIPRSRGGSDDRSNLQLLCSPCNSAKGAKTMEEWLGEAP